MQIPTQPEKLAEMDARLSRIEGIVEQIATRLTSVEQGQRDLSNRIDGLSNRIVTLFCWLVGIQITTLLTLGTLILVKLG